MINITYDYDNDDFIDIEYKLKNCTFIIFLKILGNYYIIEAYLYFDEDDLRPEKNLESKLNEFIKKNKNKIQSLENIVDNINRFLDDNGEGLDDYKVNYEEIKDEIDRLQDIIDLFYSEEEKNLVKGGKKSRKMKTKKVLKKVPSLGIIK